MKTCHEISIFLKHKQFQARIELIFLEKLAETIFEVVLPDYFKTFQTNFKFIITEKVPNLPNFKNHAFGSHFKSDFGPRLVEIANNSHYYILIQ